MYMFKLWKAVPLLYPAQELRSSGTILKNSEKPQYPVSFPGNVIIFETLKDKMADDHVLETKLFNFICGSGGFVDLTVLLKSSSPLGSRKSKESAKKWLESRQGPRAGFACVKDQNGEIVGVRVDLRKKVCYRYATKGICRFRRRKQGNCKYWHICKTFVEGRCDDFCELSHDFYSDDNWEIAEDLNLPEDKYSNGAMKKIVSWSLP